MERRFIDAGMETLLLVDDDPSLQGDDRPGSMPHISPQGPSWLDVSVGDGPQPFSFARAVPSKDGKVSLGLWIRRPASAAGTPVEGDIYDAANGILRGERFRFRALDSATVKSDAALIPEWERALAERLRGGPWQVFASQRLRDLAPEKKAPAKAPAQRRTVIVRPPPSARRPSDSLAGLMETTTGAVAVQEALQQDRALFLSAAHERPSLPLSTLKGPALVRHPWSDMLRRLDVSPPVESLAAAAPAEFYYARATSLSVLLRVLDQVDAWGTPASHALGGDAEDHDLAARYEAQLGLRRGPLTRAIGPSVVADLAVVGSDPYLKEGSDVTLLLRVKDRALLDVGLQMAMAEHEKTHGTITTRKATMAGVAVTVARSADGAVRQHRASAGDLELLSNSPAAITRVLETLQGRHAPLADELDFQFMLARDSTTRADGLAYMSDRFVAEVVGPRQKIAEARRQIALAQLMTPGFAALLYGHMYGRSPASVANLVKARLLLPTEMSHATGEVIVWKPGEAARSAWGTPASLTPLLDLPQPDLVTESERAGYARFARTYESDWAEYVDPVAIRIALEDAVIEGRAMTRMAVDLRELPLLDRTKYRELVDEVGAARFDVGSADDGMRVVAGIGEESDLRRLATRSLSWSSHDVKLDWLGDWAMLGMLNRSQVAVATTALFDDDLPQPPRTDDDGHRSRRNFLDVLAQQVPKLPLYAAVAIGNPLGATVALAGLRARTMESTPGLVEWGESGKHRGVAIVRVGINGKKAREELGQEVDTQIFYAIAEGAILASLSEPTLRRLIDNRLDGRGPKAPSMNIGGEQLSVELASDKGRALWTVMMWAFEAEVLRSDSGRSHAVAEALLRGAPELAGDAVAQRALALATFGSAPLALDGGTFSLARDGVKDPFRGTAYAPRWPPLPVPGSPVDALMTAIAHARADLSFDDEGKVGNAPRMHSLHARVTVDLRP